MCVWEKETCTEFGVLISREELGSRNIQLGRIGLEGKSVGKNWVEDKISREELGWRKNQWGRIGFEEKSVGKNWVRGKISQEQLGSRKDQSRTIGFEKKSVGNNWGSCFCYKHRARARAWQSLR